MGKGVISAVLIVSLLIISACAQTAVESPPKTQEPANVDAVSEDAASETKKTETEEKIEEISPEVRELLDTADKKVNSLRYSYKGPETKDFFYDFFVKGDNIRYIIDPDYKVVDVDDDAYDTIYINKELKTAKGYCDNRKCKVKGKKTDFIYEDAYIWTPLDWIDHIEFAEKTGEFLSVYENGL